MHQHSRLQINRVPNALSFPASGKARVEGTPSALNNSACLRRHLKKLRHLGGPRFGMRAPLQVTATVSLDSESPMKRTHFEELRVNAHNCITTARATGDSSMAIYSNHKHYFHSISTFTDPLAPALKLPRESFSLKGEKDVLA